MRITLRPLCGEDLNRIYEWHNSEDLYSTLGGQCRHPSRDVVREWLARRISATDELNQAICDETDRHLGNVYLRHIDLQTRSAELEIFIAEAGCRGQGIGTNTIRQVLKDAFTLLKLQRVYLHVLEDNEPAIRAYKNCGFTIESKLPNPVLKKGELKHLLLMAVEPSSAVAGLDCHEV